MTNLRGMTITQLYDTINEMREVYPFENSETRIVNTIVNTIHEPSGSNRQLEVCTINKAENVKVILIKEVEIDDEY